MKTQIITLASHDDLVSVRDRMSWAKSPRILIVWPAYEQVPLRALDLRILQQHAGELGAQMGLVTRRAEVRRDAESFGIPVFRSTADAQRGPWSGPRHLGTWRRRRRTAPRGSELRAMRKQLRAEGQSWSSAPIPRIGFFVLAVLAVMSIASLFVPSAIVRLTPITMQQSSSITFEISALETPASLAGRVPAQALTIPVSGTETMRVESQSQVPKVKARGTVRFDNLIGAPVVVPVGTVVYSVTPSSVRFATLQEARLLDQANASADVLIEALEAGAVGNLPSNAIQGIEGSLGASAAVTNVEPTSGGLDAVEDVPSQADRGKLHSSLLEALRAEAESTMRSLLGADDLVLPGAPVLASIDQETFDPPLGQPGSVLSLAMTATYNATFVRGADLGRLADVTLDASMPEGFIGRPGTLGFDLAAATAAEPDAKSRFSLQARRTIMRQVDVEAANRLIRGRTPKQALYRLGSSLPLAAPPEIQMTPPWWPWLPLIPFRLSVVIA